MGARTSGRGKRWLIAAAAVAAALGAGAPAARAGTIGDRYLAEGNDFFRKGNYFLASESYRCAVLDDPTDGERKLRLASSLFALGHYAYASVSIRRGVKALGFPDDLDVEIAPLFPNPSAFDRSLGQARRYLQYYPSDPHALTVVAWVAYFAGDRDEAERACRRLLALDGRDPFAAYVVRRIEMSRGGPGAPPTALTATVATTPPAAPAKPPVAVAPKPPAAAPARQPAKATTPPPAAKTPPVAKAAPPAPKKEEPADDAARASAAKKEARPGERLGPTSSISSSGEPKPALAR